MGLFSRKKENEWNKTPSGTLPELPKLPDFSEDDDFGPIHKLPSMPSSSLGTKFSQDTIKEAVAGEKEDREFPDADDFDDESEDEDLDEMRMMQEPLRKPLTKELWKSSGSEGFNSGRNVGEPVFIRIDNFEEALKIFNDTKKKISNIEHTLSEIKKLKEREESELKSWENEIRSMKDQIEKADRDIFSKI
ncbi:MAG: hypothetical protein KJ879_02080 [Nanoarchaeota archaeon]|nr:hypothetical protein [Nanoarchaeota archaeon]